jgi:hypothetical protein
MHCLNLTVTTLFMRVTARFPFKNRKFAPFRETPLALSINSNFIFATFLRPLA